MMAATLERLGNAILDLIEDEEKVAQSSKSWMTRAGGHLETGLVKEKKNWMWWYGCVPLGGAQ